MLNNVKNRAKNLKFKILLISKKIFLKVLIA